MNLRRRRPALLVPALAATALLALAACGSADAPASGSTGAAGSSSGAAAADGDLVIYSGRNEKLVSGLLDQLSAATGVKVSVRYAGSSELAAQLLEEGDATNADLFFSQDAGALGALGAAGRLEALDPALTATVIDGYADPANLWVGTSARARVVAYHPGQAPEAAQMTSIDAVLDPRYKGKVGFAPSNASFHAFVTALRVTKGEDGAKTWLERFRANEPKAYDSNVAVLDGVDKAEVSLGLINHYYWFEKSAEKGESAVTAKIRFLGSDDPGALINVAGVGVLKGTDQKEAATKAVSFLLGPQAQKYFTETTFEYPVVDGTPTPAGLPALKDLRSSSVDLNKLDSLDRTLALLGEVGLT
ncbi:iron(III) transport system substrate-binding protein [Humibacillus xanthopallidus]|uniref:Iron(III) transport system substrate-binding protein n=1 Tax=Humibacillus xanthopallidus TaxID=412689 RepID=A0A543PTG3_9MICO|nr:extracellular solute-binding protein [Humibacillus xanthopallidus]TQN47346.1 iron(III) transport system substrate-binding protein [Humibacillus xanthopallidus]